MRVLVTGSAGFIGFFLSKCLLELGHHVVGIDNINDYYSTNLKFKRLEELGIFRQDAETYETPCFSKTQSNFIFYRIDLANAAALSAVFKKHSFDKVCHLAAQAGVRYSIDNPSVYIQSNLVGFGNLLEEVKDAGIDHLIYASSSSVYGESKETPFNTNQRVDHPISLYAATKKANELMAHSYSHLYGMATTGLRFFTVYGPFGRPDMAYFLFTKAINGNKPIKVFNRGKMLRDFTYIDDVVEALIRIVEKPVKNREKYKIYNVGNNKSEKLGDFIAILEKHLGKPAKKELLPLQAGDVIQTYADVGDLIYDYQFSPKTNINEGLEIFVKWYLNCKIEC